MGCFVNICGSKNNSKSGKYTQVILQQEYQHHFANITCVLLTNKKMPRKLLTSSQDNRILIYDAEKMSFEKELTKEKDTVTYISETSSGKIIVCGRTPFLKIYDLDSCECLMSLNSPFSTGSVWKAVELDEIDQGKIATIGAEKIIKFFDPSNGYECSKTIETQQNLMRCFMELKKGKIVVGGLNGGLCFYDYQTEKCEAVLPGVNCFNVNGMFYDKPKDILLVGGCEVIFLINTVTHQLINKLNYNKESVGGNCFCQMEDDIIYAGLRNGDLLKINPLNYEILDSIKDCTHLKKEISDIKFIGKRRVVTVSNDFCLRFWMIPQTDEDRIIASKVHQMDTMKNSIS